MLALKELRGSPLKFGLITLAIALVVSLTMLMSAMSEGLITGMTAAKGTLEADLLVYQADAQQELERSMLSPEDVQAIAGTPGVASVYEVGHAMAAAGPAGSDAFDVRVFGLTDRFEQLPIVAGSGGPPRPGEAVVDSSAREEGVELGQILRLSPLGLDVKVIGFTEGRRYLMAPTVYVDMATWRRVYAASILGVDRNDAAAATLPSQLEGVTSIAAVDLSAGVTAEQVAARLGERFDVLAPDEAALAGNGMAVMVLAVDAIQGFSLGLGALIIGIFFYVTTLHKSTQMAAVKALGASNGYLYRQLLIQILALVTLASLVGMGFALAAGASMPPTMAMDADAGRWALTLLAVYGMALVGSLFSLRGILRIDPATALDRGEH